MEKINAVGRRKAAVARVFVGEGKGEITINKIVLEEYFPSPILQFIVKQPLNTLDAAEKYDIISRISITAETESQQILSSLNDDVIIYKFTQDENNGRYGFLKNVRKA